MNKGFKNIPGYEGLYQVNDIGEIRSIKQRGANKPKMLKTRIQKNGYLTVCLYDKNSNKKSRLVHRLVLMTFTGGKKLNLEVNHKNGVKSDNRLQNLEWVTKSENKIHALARKLVIPVNGVKHHNAKLNNYKVSFIRSEYKKGMKTMKYFADKFNVSQTTIREVITNQIWKKI